VIAYGGSKRSPPVPLPQPASYREQRGRRGARGATVLGLSRRLGRKGRGKKAEKGFLKLDAKGIAHNGGILIPGLLELGAPFIANGLWLKERDERGNQQVLPRSERAELANSGTIQLRIRCSPCTVPGAWLQPLQTDESCRWMVHLIISTHLFAKDHRSVWAKAGSQLEIGKRFLGGVDVLPNLSLRRCSLPGAMIA